MNTWAQIVIEVDRSPDEALLIERVAPLIEALRPTLLSWHFFWEPDLWVRLRFRTSEDRAMADARIGEALTGLVWRITEYSGDAAMMGSEMWARCERDFENGAEHALAVARHARDGALTRTRDFHWARHVHTFTNQLTGSWAEEARLCARQLRYRAWLLGRARDGAHQSEVDALVAKIDEVLTSLSVLHAAERDLHERWVADGRPPIPALVELPPWFDYDPDRAMGPDPGERGS